MNEQITDRQMYIGSLSNDLFRIASLVHRGSHHAASRFLKEAKRWSVPLLQEDVKHYIRQIARDVSDAAEVERISLADAERYLMYGVLLQNYVLHDLHESPDVKKLANNCGL